MKKYTVFILILLCINIACNNKDTDFVAKFMKYYPELNQRKIIFGNYLKQINNSSAYQSSQLSNSRNIIVITISSLCGPCYITIEKWNKYLNSNMFQNTDILFIANGEYNEAFTNEINKYNYKFPIFIDESDSFDIKNNLYHKSDTYLLNSENKIIFLGSPISSEILMNYYKILTNNN